MSVCRFFISSRSPPLSYGRAPGLYWKEPSIGAVVGFICSIRVRFFGESSVNFSIFTLWIPCRVCTIMCLFAVPWKLGSSLLVPFLVFGPTLVAEKWGGLVSFSPLVFSISPLSVPRLPRSFSPSLPLFRLCRKPLVARSLSFNGTQNPFTAIGQLFPSRLAGVPVSLELGLALFVSFPVRPDH